MVDLLTFLIDILADIDVKLDGSCSAGLFMVDLYQQGSCIFIPRDLLRTNQTGLAQQARGHSDPGHAFQTFQVKK